METLESVRQDGNQRWRRFQSLKKLPMLLAANVEYTPRTAVLLTLFAGSERGSASGRQWLKSRAGDDGTIGFGDLLISAAADHEELSELWYQYCDIIYPAMVGNPFPVLYHEGPYELIEDCSVHQGDIVLDVGANMGLFSLVAQRKAARVIAFEPDQRARRMLERHLSLNNISTVEVEQSACGNIEGKSTISNMGGLGTARVAPSAEGVALDSHNVVQLTTIDSVVSRRNLPRVDFIKMDIEGYEPFAIEGAGLTIARFLPKLSLCTYHDESHPILLREILTQLSDDRYQYIQTEFKIHAYPRTRQEANGVTDR